MGVALGISLSLGAQAALTPLGGEFPLLGDLKGHQKNPHVALGSTGGFVVWQTTTESDSTERVMVQRLGGDMTGLGAATRLSRSSESWNELNPRVALLANGGAAVVWVGGPRSSTDIYFRLVNADGNYPGTPELVNTFLTGIQSAPAISTLSNGEIVVIWTSMDQDAEGEGVFGQIFTAGGARLGGEFRINQSEASNQSEATLVSLDNGRFIAAWVDESVAGLTSLGAQNLRGNLVGRIFDSQGRALGSEYQLNGEQGVGFSPAITANSDGGFTLAWEQRDEENMRNLSDIYVRTFNSSGLPLTNNQRHNTWLRGQQMAPELIQLGEETLVVWASFGQDDSGGGIQGRLLSGGREFQVNTQGRMHQRSPSVATDGGNKFLVVWVNTASPTHSILSGQRYVNSDVDSDGVMDVTAGEVKVVSASEARRRATPMTQASQPQPVLTVATDSTVTTDSTVRAQAFARSSLATRSATAGRNTLLAAARQRISGARTLTTRSARTLSQSRVGQPTTSSPRYSFAQRLASQQATASRLSIASRQFQSSTGQRVLASASSRYNTITRNSLSRIGTRQSKQARLKPVATSLQRAGEGLRIQWSSRQGARYQVQGSSDLREWSNVGATRSGLGGRDSMQVNTKNDRVRYYRVVQVD